MNILVDHTLEQFGRALTLYERASGRKRAEVIEKKGRDYKFSLARRFGELAPARGQVRSERLAALRAGGGLKIRQRAYDDVARRLGVQAIPGRMLFRRRRRIKGVIGLTEPGELQGSIRSRGRRLNVQALAARRELAIREGGRGFLRQSARFGGDRAVARSGLTLASSETQPEALILTWGPFTDLSREAAKAIMRTRGQAAVAMAMSDVMTDMLPYLNRKLGEAAVEAGMRVA